MGDKQTAIRVLRALSGRSGRELHNAIHNNKYKNGNDEVIDSLDAVALAEYAAALSVGTGEDSKRLSWAMNSVAYSALAMAKHLVEEGGNGNSGTGTSTDGEHPPTGENIATSGGEAVD